MNELDIVFEKNFIQQLEERVINDLPTSSWDLFKMTYDIQKSTLIHTSDDLLAIDYLPHLTCLPHQLNTAKQVVMQMNGCAILADEVGLGKTIEAGLILKEYMIRGLVKKVLILVPASLVNQWIDELVNKFYIPAVAYRKGYSWKHVDIMVASLDTAKRAPHCSEIHNINYDLIIIDEAHKLKNHQTKNYQFVKGIKKKYCLLLTATPIQNHLSEIFNLISILKPGHLGNYKAFIEKYVKAVPSIEDNHYLKELINKVMIRHTRKDTNIKPSKRHIKTIWVDFSKEEETYYKQLEYELGNKVPFLKLTLLREICSSREACYMSLKKLSNNSDHPVEDLHSFIDGLEKLPQHAKARKVIEIIKKIGNEKVIIFTEYHATQYFLQWYLQQHGISSVPYRGGFSRSKKEWMRQLFQHDRQVLIATEAGGEGINLQFCHYMINYDLPWNPMRLEQRIGRIHRYGQKKDVYIYNLATKQTIEEHIMNILYKKLNLFERVIGELDDILSKLLITDLESEIQAIFHKSTSTGEAKVKLNHLTSIIQENIELYEEMGETNGTNKP
ncbi:SNF2 family DNA or RNA helicase [Cerasibacillus quisquiliarum]|uniref:Helicase n=1 Tax=Cerasibacillus quisquiliarum TaxID=227865 RepID=A0A511UWV6_9BACI|nr:SNF2-related protein [Cerasibacillus quisquiliarum]MBB5145489.1 SNF2 family DNA or RNA helicase [Cerasibacillus quisquiliarum]GEN31116.1 helicase [Cerasibacillus quisquiliarum]